MGKLKNSISVFSLILFSGLSMTQMNAIAQEQSADEWLSKMADAIIESGTEVETITTEVEQTVMSPMGEVTVSGTTTVNFLNGDQYANLETPQGNVEVIIEDGEGTQKVGAQEMPLAGAQLAQIETETQRNYVYIALNVDSLSAEYLGTETIDDTEHVKIEVDLTVPVTYFINTETALPSKITYVQFNQQTGQDIEVEVQYSDWQTVSGVTYAFTTETFANGQQASTGTVSELTVNK